MKSLSTLVRDARADEGLSQPELAKRSGVSLRAVSKIENGKPIKLETVRRVFEGFKRIPKSDWSEWVAATTNQRLGRDAGTVSILSLGVNGESTEDMVTLRRIQGLRSEQRAAIEAILASDDLLDFAVRMTTLHIAPPSSSAPGRKQGQSRASKRTR